MGATRVMAQLGGGTRHIVWGVGVALLLFWLLGKLEGAISARDAEITATSRAALVAHPALVRERAKLQAAEARLTALSLAASRRSDSLRLLLARGVRTDTVAVLREIATEDSTAVLACREGLLTCGQRAANAEAEAQRLQDQLTKQITVGQCRILFMPCPSRTLMFILGVGAGFGASAAMQN